ncbi:hypothetical protein [Ascidiimonas aurantiaca]|uniref:hypothetical protein n=1 Tax=Ascidiimonas aurantiaca TaxID=1685432 RepID=UPI0030EF5EFF
MAVVKRDDFFMVILEWPLPVHGIAIHFLAIVVSGNKFEMNCFLRISGAFKDLICQILKQ